MQTKKIVLAGIYSAAIILSQACSSGKGMEKGEQEIVNLCAGSEYQKDRNTFRASAMGESMDQMMAKKKAMSEARIILATQVETMVKSVMDNHAKSTGQNKTEEFQSRYETLSRETVSRTLSGITTICDKMTKTKEGTCKSYVCLQIDRISVEKAINEFIRKDEVLSRDYDFKEINYYMQEL